MNFPIIFAHRGANSFAPENSLAAIHSAIELGCDGIELDVRLSADGEVVVFHDRNTLRMTGTPGSVGRLPLSRLKQFRLLHRDGSAESIPTLQEALELAGDKILINLDVKKESMAKNGVEEKVIKILRDQHLEENIIISSFNPIVLNKFRSLNPNLHLGFIYRNRSSLLMLNGQPVRSMHVRYRLLSLRHLENLRQRGCRIYAWTVDDPAAMHDLMNKNVDGIITNRPELYFSLRDRITRDKNGTG